MITFISKALRYLLTLTSQTTEWERFVSRENVTISMSPFITRTPFFALLLLSQSVMVGVHFDIKDS